MIRRLHARYVDRPLGSFADLAAEVQAILARALSLGNAQFGNVQLMDWRSGYLHIAAHHGLSADFLAFFDRVASDRSACGHALIRRRAKVVRDVEKTRFFSPVCRNAGLAAGAQSVPPLLFPRRRARSLEYFHGYPRDGTLILIAENGGPTKLARIGVTSALNRHIEPEYDPGLKMPHWGKRKLKRDQ